MLAPIRDHLSPKDPASAPLVCSTKERYFSRLSVRAEPGKPGFEEASGGTVEPAEPLVYLSLSFLSNNQLDAAEEAISRAIDISPEKGEQSLVCVCQKILGTIYQLEGEIEKAIHHCEVALGTASHCNHSNTLFEIHSTLAQLFFDDAQAHIKHVKSHATNDNDAYLLAQAMELQALVWYG